MSNSISRLVSIFENSATLEEYNYLGLGTVVRRGHPEPGVDQTFIKQSGESNGDVGDPYIGLDRFGRIVDQRWIETTTPDDIDRFQYGYDRNSNRTYRENALDAVFSELYAYDSLNQLTSFDRGELNGTKAGIVGTPSRSQDWDLGAMGNWDSLANDGGTPESRTHNSQNQVTEVGSATLTFDANGNMTTDEAGRELVYDAWNRLVEVLDDQQQTIVSHEHDALGRRIAETRGSETRDLYYSASWQVLEEQVSGATEIQYVWSPVYVDAMVLRDRDTDANGSLDERLYATHDANFNISALVDVNGNVVERFVYEPYGSFTIHNADWSQTRSSSDYDWQYLHQGGRYSYDIGLLHFGFRDYSPTLGRWGENDPIGLAGGDANLYRALFNNPVNWIDPSGLIGVTWQDAGQVGLWVLDNTIGHTSTMVSMTSPTPDVYAAIRYQDASRLIPFSTGYHMGQSLRQSYDSYRADGMTHEDAIGFTAAHNLPIASSIFGVAEILENASTRPGEVGRPLTMGDRVTRGLDAILEFALILMGGRAAGRAGSGRPRTNLGRPRTTRPTPANPPNRVGQVAAVADDVDDVINAIRRVPRHFAEIPKAKIKRAIKILREYRRLAQKQGVRLSERRLAELDRLRDAGRISTSDLPGSLLREFPNELAGLCLEEIESLR